MMVLVNAASAFWKDESGITTVEGTVLVVLVVGGFILLADYLEMTAQFGTGWAG
jgi:Flp pilus assembly pilin Flp